MGKKVEERNIPYLFLNDEYTGSTIVRTQPLRSSDFNICKLYLNFKTFYFKMKLIPISPAFPILHLPLALYYFYLVFLLRS